MDSRIINNNMERSITGDVGEDGFLSINALASSPDKQDSFNCNIVIADEMHTYQERQPVPGPEGCHQGIHQQAGHRDQLRRQAGYRLLCQACGIRTEDPQRNGHRGGGGQRICLYRRGPENRQRRGGLLQSGGPGVLQPRLGTQYPPSRDDQRCGSARDDPQLRTEFLQKSLNVFTAALNAWFDIEEFRRSDRKYDWSMDELRRFPSAGMGVRTCLSSMT